MRDERIAEIAAEFIPFLKGDNDAIAADPRRWREEMTSWSAQEASQVVAALIRKAVNEAYDNAALKVDSYSYGLHLLKSPLVEGADGAAKLIRALKDLR